MEKYPILIAEDDTVMRTLLEKSLCKEGYQVKAVENGLKAFNILHQEFFPIVITDWNMPEMDGMQLCNAIRQNQSWGYIFVILFTGKDSKKDLIAGLKAGADEYLTKPVDHLELLARLNTGRRILELQESLKNAYNEIKALAIIDPLTGIYNRRYMMELLPKEVKRSRRYRHPLSLILLDIDHFKHINDTYGHQFGDEVLRDFAQNINDWIRSNVDWVVRYGGEEFIIVVPETSIKNTVSMARRLCCACADTPITVQQTELIITASFGVTGITPDTPPDQANVEALVSFADKYMYQAKQEGRNRIVHGAIE